MGIYFTKTQLYNQIDDIRLRLGISESDYPLKFRAIAENIPNLSIGEMIIRTPGLRAMASASRNKNLENDAIVLKAGSEQREQNFYCAHEYLHLVFHRNEQRNFSCYDKIQKQQNPFYEWHANEGAAELLVPYRLFIPKFYELSEKYRDVDFPIDDIIKSMHNLFDVTEAVISYRLSGLAQELYQYRHGGKEVERIRLISQKQAVREDLPVPQLPLYCRKCYSLLEGYEHFCPICGEQVTGNGFIKLGIYDSKRAKGAGYMKYIGIPTKASGRVVECPKCHNEEVKDDSRFCHICGSPSVNYCYGHQEDDGFGNWEYVEHPCELGTKNPLPGNARYCPYCGNHTTFFAQSYLKAWDYKPEPPTADDLFAEELSDFEPLDTDSLPF